MTELPVRKQLLEQAKKDRNRKYYLSADNKVECPTCGRTINKYYIEAHQKTKQHLRFLQIYETKLKK